MAGGAAVDVSEELPDVTVGAAVAEERIVVEDDSLPPYTDGHLLGDQFEVAHESLADGFHVVVAQNEVFVAGEGIEDIIPKARTAVGEIAQVEDDTIVRNGLPPSSDEFGIHLRRIYEWSVAESDDVLVAEVGVGGEPDVLGLKFEDGFHGLYVSAKVKFFPNPCKSLQGLQRFGKVKRFTGVVLLRSIFGHAWQSNRLYRSIGLYPCAQKWPFLTLP